MFWQLTFKRQSHIFDVTEQVAAWFQSFNTKNISVHKYPLFIRVFWKYLRRFNVGGRIILFLTVLCFTSLKTVLLMKFTLLFSTMISLLMCLQHKQSRPVTKTKKLHVYMDKGFRLRLFFFLLVWPESFTQTSCREGVSCHWAFGATFSPPVCLGSGQEQSCYLSQWNKRTSQVNQKDSRRHRCQREVGPISQFTNSLQSTDVFKIVCDTLPFCFSRELLLLNVSFF